MAVSLLVNTIKRKKPMSQILNELAEIQVVAETPTLESAQVLGNHIVDVAGESSSVVYAYQKEPLPGDEPGDEVFKCFVILKVEPQKLERALVTLDGVKAGYTTPSETMLFHADILANISVTPALGGMHGGTDAVNQLHRYLTNKVQEQQKAINSLEEQMSEMNQSYCKVAMILNGYQERYESFNTYIHSTINLNAMAQVVHGLAERVDGDLLEDFPRLTIH